MRDKKELAHFLMPDAPLPKKSRKSFPERVVCPLKEGTPAVPPPRIPQPWELKRTNPPAERLVEMHPNNPPRNIEIESHRMAGPDCRLTDAGMRERTPPRNTDESNPMLTPSMGILRLDDVNASSIVDAEIEHLLQWPVAAEWYKPRHLLPNPLSSMKKLRKKSSGGNEASVSVPEATSKKLMKRST